MNYKWKLQRGFGVILFLIILILGFIPVLDATSEVKCNKNISVNSDNKAKNCNSKNKMASHRVLIKYSTEKNENSMFSNLKATINGTEHLIIDSSAEMCLSMFDERDYDGNGTTDALVTNILGCGGNCCANSFLFITYKGDGRFQVSESFGNSWNDPKIEPWKGNFSVVMTENNEGMNTDAPKEVFTRYVLDSGHVNQIEAIEKKQLLALMEMKSAEFNYDKNDEVRKIKFDLNGDGIKDQVVGILTHRWGRIMWTLTLSGVGEVKNDIACKRIGILTTKTNNLNDIVCDIDRVLRWNGLKYSE